MITTLKQLVKQPRSAKIKKFLSSKLLNRPQRKAICLRFLTLSPKKPNSANRAVVKAIFVKNNTKLTAKVPGESNNIQQHSTLLINGARVRDLIAVSYSVIPGCFDCSGVAQRKTKRSRYGVKKS